MLGSVGSSGHEKTWKLDMYETHNLSKQLLGKQSKEQMAVVIAKFDLHCIEPDFELLTAISSNPPYRRSLTYLLKPHSATVLMIRITANGCG